MKYKFLLFFLLNSTVLAVDSSTPKISRLISFINTNIEIKVDSFSVPSQEEILQTLQDNLSLPVDEVSKSIQSLQEFKDITQSTNLKEISSGIMQGELVTNQKLFGIFDVQIPYQVTYDSFEGEVTEKITNGIWNYILDLISF